MKSSASYGLLVVAVIAVVTVVVFQVQAGRDWSTAGNSANTTSAAAVPACCGGSAVDALFVNTTASQGSDAAAAEGSCSGTCPSSLDRSSPAGCGGCGGCPAAPADEQAAPTIVDQQPAGDDAS